MVRLNSMFIRMIGMKLMIGLILVICSRFVN